MVLSEALGAVDLWIHASDRWRTETLDVLEAATPFKETNALTGQTCRLLKKNKMLGCWNRPIHVGFTTYSGRLPIGWLYRQFSLGEYIIMIGGELNP